MEEASTLKVVVVSHNQILTVSILKILRAQVDLGPREFTRFHITQGNSTISKFTPDHLLYFFRSFIRLHTVHTPGHTLGVHAHARTRTPGRTHSRTRTPGRTHAHAGTHGRGRRECDISTGTGNTVPLSVFPNHDSQTMIHIPPDTPSSWIPRLCPAQAPRIPMTHGSFFGDIGAAKTTNTTWQHDPCRLIAEFLLPFTQEAPRRRYPKSCSSLDEDDMARLSLRLVSKPFSKMVVAQVGIRVALTELCRNVREMPHEDCRKLFEILVGRHSRVLDVSYATDLTDAEIIVALRRAPLIRVFNCRGCTGLSDSVFKELSACRRVVSVQVGDCPKLSGRGLLSTLRAKRFPASCLRELLMPNLKFVDDMLMENILRAIGSGLRILDDQGTNIGDSTMRSIARHNKSLERLVAGFNQVTDVGLIALSTSTIGENNVMPMMVELDVGHNPISDTGVLAVCHAFRKLETLRVCGMENRLSLGCVHTLSQSLSLLKLLDIRFCSKVRPEHLGSFLWRQKRVEIVR